MVQAVSFKPDPRYREGVLRILTRWGQAIGLGSPSTFALELWKTLERKATEQNAPHMGGLNQDDFFRVLAANNDEPTVGPAAFLVALDAAFESFRRLREELQ